MSTPSRPAQSWPVFQLVLFAVAAALYVLMLADAVRPLPGGEANFGNAFEAFFVTTGLWIVLAAMLLVGYVAGAIARWTAPLAIVLVPMSGVAAFVAIDMCSRHLQWAIIFPALLPPLIASYALWARWRQLRGAPTAQPISVATWIAILILTCAPLLLAAWF